MTTREVSVFQNGGSQAVRLPAEFRFDADKLYATRDEATGDVTLSARPGAADWAAFFERVHEVAATGALDDFMRERPMNRPPEEKHLFDDFE